MFVDISCSFEIFEIVFKRVRGWREKCTKFRSKEELPNFVHKSMTNNGLTNQESDSNSSCGLAQDECLDDWDCVRLVLRLDRAARGLR